jgi:hypothetical protein
LDQEQDGAGGEARGGGGLGQEALAMIGALILKRAKFSRSSGQWKDAS